MKAFVACGLLCVFAPTAFAAVTAEQIGEYLNNNDRFEDAGLYGDQATFYKALKDAPARSKVAGAAATLASKWSIDPSRAARVVELSLQLDSVQIHDDAGLRLQRLGQELKGILRSEPNSAGLWGYAVQLWSDFGGCQQPAFRDEYLAKPFAETNYINLVACQEWVIAFARLHPDNFTARFALTYFLEDRDPAAALAAARWAMDEVPRTGMEAEALAMATRRIYWIALGKHGLSGKLLAEGAALTPAELERVLHEPFRGSAESQEFELIGSKEVQDMQAAVAEQWLLGLIAAGRSDDARSELARQSKPGSDAGYAGDILADKSGGDIFDRYVGDGEKGVLWNLYGDGVTATRLVADFLAKHEMESGAVMLHEQLCRPYFARRGSEQLDGDLATLPEAFQKYRQAHASLIAEVRSAAGCTKPRQSAELSSKLPRREEVPLTAEQRAHAALPDHRGKIPVPRSFAVVRAESSGQQLRAVCISPAVDPGGEVSPGGYWLVRSNDGGSTWLTPVYLGFQYQQPYVVREKARVSMFAPNVLRLEVAVEELDPESITFPPVELSLRREAKDLYIDLPLDEIDRDTDADGFTDLLEAKLATDPTKADTDGDGLSDSLDDFPQASARAEAGPYAPIVVDMLKQLVGFESAGIIVPVRKGGGDSLDSMLSGMKHAEAGSVLFQLIEGDASQFNGLRADGQVIVISPEQVAEISARSGPFYPLSFPTILMDPQHTRALVKWSAGWRGGTLIYHLKDGRWISERAREWITRAAPVTSRPKTSPG